MTDLISSVDLAEWVGINDLEDEARLAPAAAAASRMVTTWCGRSFDTDTSATARYFYPLDPYTVFIDDAWEVTAVATDDNDDGLWSTAWSASDYYLDPPGGVGPNGQTGWPYTKLRAVESRYFPQALRPVVKVTAKWGWPTAAPDDVVLAAKMLGAELFKSRSGGSEYFTADGSFTPIRRNFIVRDLLQPYRTATANDARFVIL